MLLWVWAGPGLNKPQAFKNVSLQNNHQSNIHFLLYILQKLALYIQVFDVRYEWRKWKRYPFTAPSFGFHKNLSLPLPISASTSVLKKQPFLFEKRCLASGAA